jgi:hypothetical protein
MNLFTWAESRIRKFSIWDIAVFKTYLFFLGMIVGAYVSQFVQVNIWYFAVIVVLSLVWLLYRMFGE